MIPLLCAQQFPSGQEVDRGRLDIPHRLDRRDPVHPVVFGLALIGEVRNANLGTGCSCADAG